MEEIHEQILEFPEKVEEEINVVRKIKNSYTCLLTNYF